MEKMRSTWSTQDLDPVSKKAFTQELERLGFSKVKIHDKSYYKGLKLVSGDGQRGLI